MNGSLQDTQPISNVRNITDEKITRIIIKRVPKHMMKEDVKERLKDKIVFTVKTESSKKTTKSVTIVQLEKISVVINF